MMVDLIDATRHISLRAWPADRVDHPRCRLHCGRRAEIASLVHRYYDPGTEQFLSVDALVNQTGTPYAYTPGDPVNAADPLGESLWGDITGVVKSTVHFVEKHKKAFEIAGLVVGSVAVVASDGILLAGAGAVEFAGVSVDTLATVSDVASLGAAATDLPVAWDPEPTSEPDLWPAPAQSQADSEEPLEGLDQHLIFSQPVETHCVACAS
jgi:hypothetical protein